MIQRFLGIAAIGLLAGLTLAGAVMAQEGPTATPAQINLSTAVPATAAPQANATATWTPQPAAQVFLEALDEANVRAQADTSASRLGSIRAGELYVVTARYFEWFQFEYPPSPNGLGWVFGQLVNVTGDVSTVPVLELDQQATIDPRAVEMTTTMQAITQTPGGLLTATAAFQQLQQNQPLEGAAPQTLPTFTYPPDISGGPPTAGPTPTPELTAINVSDASGGSAGLPPIVPIAALLGLGVLGLLVGGLRGK
jgi:uncharacterized protein YraI